MTNNERHARGVYNMAASILGGETFPDLETVQAVAAECRLCGHLREAAFLDRHALRLAGGRARLHAYNAAIGRPDTPTED